MSPRIQKSRGASAGRGERSAKWKLAFQLTIFHLDLVTGVK